jgi:uncharacterized membrane protein
MTATPPAHPPRSLLVASAIIGFALSGFFDGILLHQVLQWHHLFSLVEGDAWRDMRNQILMDGLFHVLMYAVAAYGLYRLWRARSDVRAPGAGRAVAGGALLGFGSWNVVDVVGFHWLLGIHRIRVGVPDPLAYDLGWLAAFALPFLAGGWWILRRPGGPSGPVAAALLALLTPGAAVVAAQPAPGGRTAVALFAPAVSMRAMIDTAAAADARLLWADPASGLAAYAADRPLGAAELYGHGALAVSRSTALAGCLGWARG